MTNSNMNPNSKQLSVNLESYVIEVAQEKAKFMFSSDISAYIDWLIRNNNKREIKRKVIEKEVALEAIKPELIPNTIKVAMYENICKFCNKEILPGEEICQAKGYDNYIHKGCCKKIRSQA